MKIIILLLISISSFSQSVTYSSKDIYKQKTYHLTISRDIKNTDSTYTFLYKDMRYPMLDQYDGLILGSKREALVFFRECLAVYNKANKEKKTSTETKGGTVLIFYDKVMGIGTLVIFKQDGGLTKVLKSHLEDMISAVRWN